MGKLPDLVTQNANLVMQTNLVNKYEIWYICIWITNSRFHKVEVKGIRSFASALNETRRPVDQDSAPVSEPTGDYKLPARHCDWDFFSRTPGVPMGNHCF